MPILTENISETLIINQTLSCLKVIPKGISEHLTINETLVRNGSVFNRTINEVLPLKGGMLRYLSSTNNSQYSIREVEIVKVSKKCMIILQGVGNGTVIILPCPQMGDKEKNLHSQVVKRSMTGLLYTYVRKNALQQLTYTFVLGRPMAYDLQDFVDQNIANVITLTNWKGEIWKVQITTNPLDFIGKSLFENEGERWEVTIEFQGIRVL